MFEKLVKESFVWFPERDFGYFPVTESPYDSEYFQKYKAYAATEMGKKITQARIELVKKYSDKSVLDVGIGCGQFIQEHGNAYGYDISACAVKWLVSKSLYRSLYEGTFHSVTFWDSLEHIKYPDLAINSVERFAFVSMPIFENHESILKSKHFKKDEHCWYFTRYGLIQWFSEQQFDCLENNTMETALGREGIETFVFRRRDA